MQHCCITPPTSTLYIQYGILYNVLQLYGNPGSQPYASAERCQQAGSTPAARSRAHTRIHTPAWPSQCRTCALPCPTRTGHAHRTRQRPHTDVSAAHCRLMPARSPLCTCWLRAPPCPLTATPPQVRMGVLRTCCGPQRGCCSISPRHLPSPSELACMRLRSTKRTADSAVRSDAPPQTEVSITERLYAV